VNLKPSECKEGRVTVWNAKIVYYPHLPNRCMGWGDQWRL